VKDVLMPDISRKENAGFIIQIRVDV